MKKKITVLAIVVFTAISITGCRFRPMSGFEVYKYVHSRTGRYLFTMSKEKVEDSSAVNWTIHCPSDGLEFHVHDRLQFEIVYSERNLSDDYRYSLIQAHLDELDLGDGIEFVNENGYTFSDYDNYFSVYYSDYDDFVKKYERVTDNARLLDSYSSGLKIRYHFYYWPEERIEGEGVYPDTEYWMADEIDDVCYEEIKNGELFDEVRLNLLGFAYRYRYKEFDNLLANIDDRDYDMLFYYEGSIYDTIITKNDGSTYLSSKVTTGWDDMIIGELYWLCKQENVDVSGDSEHFYIKSPNGDVYQFSYEYISGRELYYYKNDEQVVIDDDDFVVSHDVVNEICGFKVTSQKHEYTTR